MALYSFPILLGATPCLTVTSKEEGSSSLLAILLIIGIIAVVIVIGVIAGFLFLKKRKETEKEAEEILEDKKTIIPTGPKDERFLPTQRKLPPAQPQSLKPKPVVFTPPAPFATSVYKAAEEMPRAPKPLRGDDYISPGQKSGKSETKTQVKGELGPKHTNMLNPKR